MPLVPRTYMSAAGVQSEITYEVLAKLACHDVTYKKNVEGFRHDLANNFRVIRHEQSLANQAIARYADVIKNNHLKPIVKARPDGAIVYNSDDALRMRYLTTAKNYATQAVELPVLKNNGPRDPDKHVVDDVARENVVKNRRIEQRKEIRQEDDTQLPRIKLTVSLTRKSKAGKSKRSKLAPRKWNEKKQNKKAKSRRLNCRKSSGYFDVIQGDTVSVLPRLSVVEESDSPSVSRRKPSSLELFRMVQKSTVSRNFHLVDRMLHKRAPPRMNPVAEEDGDDDVEKDDVMQAGERIVESVIRNGAMGSRVSVCFSVDINPVEERGRGRCARKPVNEVGRRSTTPGLDMIVKGQCMEKRPMRDLERDEEMYPVEVIIAKESQEAEFTDRTPEHRKQSISLLIGHGICRDRLKSLKSKLSTGERRSDSLTTKESEGFDQDGGDYNNNNTKPTGRKTKPNVAADFQKVMQRKQKHPLGIGGSWKAALTLVRKCHYLEPDE